MGLPELREAIAAWIDRRFDVRLDEATEIVPTLGSKEAIFSLAQMVVGPGKHTVVVPEPAYPVYERGAVFANAEPVFVPLLEEHGFLPDLDALEDVLAHAAVFWVNYPNNPRAPWRRSRSTSGSPSSRDGSTSCSPRTRPTPSCGSTSRRSPHSSSPTARTCSSSTPSRSARP